MGMRLGTLTMALAAASGAVWGEEGGHELGQVSVTAGGYIQQVDDAPVSISVIDRE
jgi:outer membrane receptor for ferrienterochelin and colicin|uniref:Exogenous ferric siderophore receptor n=1 Tax=Alcanivorax borkumensis (strain ATCC 700651 / DSM 11573 / NCIMB 13689 / SK2) TaxID=393595 RepID=Q0VNW1_ALCBS|nr:exogenous ferric siderophore receptor [Alcanivorax borkumensis SK2]